MHIDGIEVVIAADAVRRLREQFPQVSDARIRATLISEWEASTGGIPLVLPADVVHGASEVLRGAVIVDIADYVRS